MFKRTRPEAPGFVFTFDGQEIPAQPGDSIAAALLAAGIRATRETPAKATKRGPYCMMGACFDCLAEVDGIGGVQTCLTEARPGMTITTQHGARAL